MNLIYEKEACNKKKLNAAKFVTLSKEKKELYEQSSLGDGFKAIDVDALKSNNEDVMTMKNNE